MSEDKEEGAVCAVCFEDDSSECGAVKRAPCCAARYHPDCVRKWGLHQLAQGLPATCPTCRQPLEAKTVGATRDRHFHPIAGRCLHASWVGGFMVFFCLTTYMLLGAAVGLVVRAGQGSVLTPFWASFNATTRSCAVARADYPRISDAEWAELREDLAVTGGRALVRLVSVEVAGREALGEASARYGDQGDTMVLKWTGCLEGDCKELAPPAGEGGVISSVSAPGPEPARPFTSQFTAHALLGGVFLMVWWLITLWGWRAPGAQA